MTKKTIRFQANKLVRDKTEERLRKKNITIGTRTLETEEYILELKKKLIEEAHEVSSTTNQEELLSELADVLEVIHALGTATGLSFQKLEQKRMEKWNARGGFDSRTYCTSIEGDAESEHIEYYRSQPDKYPVEK